MDSTLRVLLEDTEKSTFGINKVGSYSAVEPILEYVLLARPAFNGGNIKCTSRNITSINWVSADEAHVMSHSHDVVQVCGKQIEADLALEFFFAPGTSLIRSTTAEPMSFLVVLYNTKAFSSRDVGEAMTLSCPFTCPGDLYPFESLNECKTALGALPVRCGDDSAYVLLGDTVACRYKHLGSSMVNGFVHCPQMALNSTKCTASQCPVVQAPTNITNELGSGEEIVPHMALRVSLAVVPVATVMAVVAGRIFLGLFWRSRFPVATSTELTVVNLPAEAQGLPSLTPRDLQLSTRKKLVFRSSKLLLGGCKLSAIIGRSGLGKRSFLRLLAGFRERHMVLQHEQ